MTRARLVAAARALAMIPALGTNASQAAPATDTRVLPNLWRNSAPTASEAARAQDWHLNSDEWVRYRQLMQGPLGVYSPQLDPLTALGIEARSDEERNRYATLQVQAEFQRVSKLLAYQRAYDLAWKRIFPNHQRVNLLGTHAAGRDSSPARLAVFVKADCPVCDQQVRRLQSAGTPFDLYLVGSRQDDARLRRWARQAGIDNGKVQARTITLNHDQGRWLSLGVAGTLPAAVRRVDGQWRRQ